MALDRQSIEKKDFPVGRRGYDPEAVDTHLAAIADEIADFKRSARRRTDTLASSASEQVRAIVEAAETSASEITREAEDEAREIREEASNEAQATREQATDQAREYVGKVSESTNAMLQRLDSMEQEMTALIESLRTGGNRLNADLQLLETDLSTAGETVLPRPRFELEDTEPEPPAVEPALEPVADAGEPAPEAVEFEEVTGGESDFGQGGDSAFDQVGAEAEFEPVAGTEGELASAGGDFGGQSPVADDNGGGSEETDDAEGARLIALNMALNGTPREETARYLSENFHLTDAGGLLDEVYASVEG